MKHTWPLLCALLPLATDQDDIYSGLVFGVGPGTFAVAVAAVIGIILCGLQNICKLPGIMVIIAICLPLIVFLICYVAPK